MTNKDLDMNEGIIDNHLKNTKHSTLWEVPTITDNLKQIFNTDDEDEDNVESGIFNDSFNLCSNSPVSLGDPLAQLTLPTMSFATPQHEFSRRDSMSRDSISEFEKFVGSADHSTTPIRTTFDLHDELELQNLMRDASVDRIMKSPTSVLQPTMNLESFLALDTKVNDDQFENIICNTLETLNQARPIPPSPRSVAMSPAPKITELSPRPDLASPHPLAPSPGHKVMSSGVSVPKTSKPMHSSNDVSIRHLNPKTATNSDILERLNKLITNNDERIKLSKVGGKKPNMLSPPSAKLITKSRPRIKSGPAKLLPKTHTNSPKATSNSLFNGGKPGTTIYKKNRQHKNLNSTLPTSQPVIANKPATLVVGKNSNNISDSNSNNFTIGQNSHTVSSDRHTFSLEENSNNMASDNNTFVVQNSNVASSHSNTLGVTQNNNIPDSVSYKKPNSPGAKPVFTKPPPKVAAKHLAAVKSKSKPLTSNLDVVNLAKSNKRRGIADMKTAMEVKKNIQTNKLSNKITSASLKNMPTIYKSADQQEVVPYNSNKSNLPSTPPTTALNPTENKKYLLVPLERLQNVSPALISQLGIQSSALKGVKRSLEGTVDSTSEKRPKTESFPTESFKTFTEKTQFPIKVDLPNGMKDKFKEFPESIPEMIDKAKAKRKAQRSGYSAFNLMDKFIAQFIQQNNEQVVEILFLKENNKDLNEKYNHLSKSLHLKTMEQRKLKQEIEQLKSDNKKMENELQSIKDMITKYMK